MPFAANIGVAVEQDVIAAASMIAILCLHASDVGYTNTFNRSRVATLLYEDIDSRSWPTKPARM